MQYNFFKWIDPRASKLGAILSVMVASMITHSELLSWYYCICQKGRAALLPRSLQTDCGVDNPDNDLGRRLKRDERMDEWMSKDLGKSVNAWLLRASPRHLLLFSLTCN